jgi:asparagine synthase (glutamine-hydrolysing)
MRRFVGTVQSDGILDTNCEDPCVFGDVSVFFRGYIANTQELCPIRSGEEPPPDSIRYAQCFAKAYYLWGSDLSCHVFGEYAVAIYDSSCRKLLLAHDSLGIVPLYYRENSRGIAFASHIDGIAGRGSCLQLDEEYVADYLCYGDHYGDRTPYVEIKRLMLGTSLSYSDRKLTRHECLTICNAKRIEYSDTRDYEDHLRTLVTAAVEASLPPQGTTWCELSGGLDSSTVLCVAARARQALKNLCAVSFTYPKSHTADESGWIRAVIEKCGVPSYALNADAVRPFTELPFDFCGQPYHAMINAARYRLYGKVLAENNVDVVLTGMGGDAVFLGDGPEPFFFADLLRKGHFFALAREVGLWADQSKQGRPALYWMVRCAVTPMIRRFRNHLIQDHPPVIPWLATDYVGGLRRNGRKRKSWVPRNTSAANSWFLERVLRCSNVVSLWDYTSSMQTEFRHPLMNLPLVEFMCSIPWEFKLCPSSDRVLQRAAFADMLPAVVAQRDTKAGPDQAIYAGLAGGSDWVRLLTERTQLSARGYVDSNRWSHAVGLARVGRCESVKHFVAAATLEVWLRQQHGKEQKPAE